ncbi:MAG: hypothetical protein K6F57_04805 [Candidatus Saccharibacteria bacterium]|nr:hypothetical protein [Candidatus Saccharibacteria bacterium]
MNPEKERLIENSETVCSLVYGEDLVLVWTVALCDGGNMIARKMLLRKCCAGREISFEESSVEYFEASRSESASLYEKIISDVTNSFMKDLHEVEATVLLDEVGNGGEDGLLPLLGLFGKTENEFKNDVGFCRERLLLV